MEKLENWKEKQVILILKNFNKNAGMWKNLYFMCCYMKYIWMSVWMLFLFSLLYFVLYYLQALVKRSPSSGMGSTLKESSAFQSELRMPESAIRHQNASPSDKGKVTICDGKPGDEDRPKKSSVCKSIEGCQEELLAQVVSKN